MTGLGPEARTFVDAARLGDEPTMADRERVRAAIALRVGAGGVAVGGLAVGGKAAGSVPKVAASRALAMALAGVIAVGTSAWVVLRAVPGSTTRAVTEGAPLALAELTLARTPVFEASSRPSIQSASAAAVSRPRAPRAPATANSTPMAAAEHGGGDVAAEAHLLGEAQTAMRAGDATRALALVDEHARRYPKGALGEERDATRIVALCELGRVSEARDAAHRFLRSAPSSPLAGPVRASCGEDGAMTTTRPF